MQMLAELDQLATSGDIRPLWRALLHLSIGNKEEALASIAAMASDLDGGDVIVLKFDPFLDPLRGDPRFDALVEKIFAQKLSQADSGEPLP